MNFSILKVLVVMIVCLGAVPVLAQEYEVDAGIVQACFNATDTPVNGLPACVGAASNACQAEPGVGTTLGIIGCHGAEAAVWDQLLNTAYGQAIAGLRAQDARQGTTPYSREDSLRAAQRAWITFRDAECTLRYAQYQDGTIRGPIQAHCVMRLTARRVFELVQLMEP